MLIEKKYEPLVSIGIPTFNRGNSLERAIKSILNQKYKNIEILISDNNSEDNTQEICLSYQKKFKNISYNRNPKNYGAFFNWKNVLNSSKGEYFMWLCDDDYIDENYVQTCINHFSINKELTIVSGVTYSSKSNFSKKNKSYGYLNDSPFLRLFKYYLNPHLNNPLKGIIKRKLINMDLFTLTFSDDWHWISEFLCQGKLLIDKSIKIYCDNGVSGDINYLYKFYKHPKIFKYILFLPSLLIVYSFLKQYFKEGSNFRNLNILDKFLIIFIIPILLFINNLNGYNKQIFRNIVRAIKSKLY